MDGGSGPENKTPLPYELGGSTGERGGEGLDRSLGRYGNAKSCTLALLDALGQVQAVDLGLKWSRIRECGDYLKFRDYFRRGVIKLTGANFCHNHLACGLCAIRRGSRGLAVYLDKVQAVLSADAALVPVLATVTVRNGENLSERLAHLLTNYRVLLDRRHAGTRVDSLMRSVAGGVYSVEVTNTGNGWHPHIHAVWLVRGDAVDSAALRSEWEALTQDSFECDVRPIESRADLGPDVNPFALGFAEVFKYATKPMELGPELFAQAYPQMRRRRLLGAFGCLRGVRVPESLTDDLVGLDEEPYIEFLCRFLGGRYRISSTGEVCGG